MQSSKAQFKSKYSLYNVECLSDHRVDIEEYVNKVERLIPTIKNIFRLSPSYENLKVIFDIEGPHYEMGGIIKIPGLLNLNSEENIYGGLFHETIHGFLEKYVHRPKGSNYFPESCAIILQVAALDQINKEWASKFASGIGSSEDNHPILFELARIYQEKGFDPIRSIYIEMEKSDLPILHQTMLIDDLNRILQNFNVKINL